MGIFQNSFDHLENREKMRIGMSENTDSTSSFHLVNSKVDMGPTDSVSFVNPNPNKLIHKEVEKGKFSLSLRNDYERDLLIKRLDESADISSGDDSSPSKSLCPADAQNIDDSQGSFDKMEIYNDDEKEAYDNTDDCDSDGKEAKSTLKPVDSGLIISPIRLTEDMPININDDETKFSSVTSNMQQKLVYIPTTKQLVAESSSHANYSNTHDQNAQNTNRPDQLNEKDSNDLSSSTETILNENGGVKFSIQVNDTSSLGGESDSLLYLSLSKNKDNDQLSLNNSENDTCMPRINTGDSLLRTFNDTTSLSSLSTCTDFSISAASMDEGCDGTGLCIDTGDGEFMEISLHSRNSFERKKNPSQDSGFEDRGSKSKKKGLSVSDFLTRNLFSRKAKESEDDAEQGWKLFGRIPPKQAPDKDPQQITQEFNNKLRSVAQPKNSKHTDIEVMSTTALILENRPQNLPTKDPEEAEKHRQQYEAMVEAARKKELKELKMKKKQKQQQLKNEDKVVCAAKRWTDEILPNWEAMKSQKKTRELWWHGIPTNVRGRVWQLAFGNDLNVTKELYEICCSRADDRIRMTIESSEIYGNSETSSEPPSSKESSVELIKLDVSRTFPQLCIFQKGGPYYDLLHSLLGAYACYRPDVGYVQGMSFIAAVLLLNMDVADAFVCFANLLNRPCQVAFFRVDEELMKVYFHTFEDFFDENMPGLYSHFKKHKVTPDLYITEWIFALFSKSLPLDIACRVWDVFCRDGEEFLFRTALGILKMYEDLLLHMDFCNLVQLLTKIPEDISSDTLFKHIDTIRMNIDKKRFNQVLAVNKES
ncbi:TBC1 domain family member 14-like isoform X1 [Mytilus trossulus]|uniref:TBC1 domain family member 14-like isoform X1 n=1 Tax=Mytilus trossulus TaxID=6551 RepID=UPI003006D45C